MGVFLCNFKDEIERAIVVFEMLHIEYIQMTPKKVRFNKFVHVHNKRRCFRP